MDGVKLTKILKIIISIMFISLCFTVINFDTESVSADVLPKFFVDADYTSQTPGWKEDHFASIQEAIDAASSGDRIIVYQGTYYENLTINKPIDLFGEDKENTIIDGGNGPEIIISSENVDISSLTITDSSGAKNISILVNADNCKIIDNIIKNNEIGVYVNNSNSATIAYNTITGTEQGISFYSSSSNVIDKNDIYSNSKNGIYMNASCNQNNISRNSIYSNSQNGIFLQNHCNQNNISRNSIYSNSRIGIRIENSSSNVIYSNNQINSNSYYGVLMSGSNNIVAENTISSNSKHGVFLIADDETTVRENTISDNIYDGIRLQNSTTDIIKDNTIKKNSRYGLYVNYYATGNRIYNNYFEDNEYNAKDISIQTNDWHTSKTLGSNIIKGPYLGGNYWSDYTGTDSNGDGVGDSSYSGIIGTDTTDAFPLVYRLPTAEAGEGYTASVGEKITFDASDSYSPDGTITSYNWDFGDDTTGSGETITHSYQTAGKYTVSLTVVNSNGGSDTDTVTVTITKDSSSPDITILQHGLSSSYSKVYIFKANVTDNVEVKNVTIEYWYPGSGIRKGEMEEIQTNIYRKMITTDQIYDKVYCVIYANDTSENLADTKKPFVDLGGPYTNCTVLENITFNATDSFDLDGNLTEYRWDFGDGSTSKGMIAYHEFNTDGVYDVVLTVEDDDGNINSKKTALRIYPQINITVTNKTRSNLEIEYDINLNENFSAYDTNGDRKVDTFVDPNEILNVLHSGSLSIDGDECFLLSVNNDISKVFLWNTAENKAINVTYQQGIISDSQGTIDKTTGNRIVIVKVDKAIWTYFEVKDYYPNTPLNGIKRSDDSDIPTSNYWRKNNKIYVLDDPDTTYKIIYHAGENEGSSGLTLKDPVFYPTERILNKQNRSIIITYNMAVDVETAVLRHLESSWVQDISSQLVTSDYKTYTYTPPNDLTNGKYQINIEAKKGNQTKENSAVFDFYSYTMSEDKGEIPLFMIIILIGFTIGMAGLAAFIIKKKNINFESFIYFKNKKIIPFFKPVVFGPLQIDVDDEKVSKAEFYVNGALKETLTKKPFKWTWNETTFMKHNIETKIYNEQGESHSTGDMTFFVFNPPKLFK